MRWKLSRLRVVMPDRPENDNDRFSHDKATAELGYRPRDLRDTLRDTVLWLRRKQAVPV